MSFAGIWRVMLSRWYVTLLGLSLAGGLVLAAVAQVAPEYTGHASVTLLAPKTGQAVNPYLGLGGLQEASDALTSATTTTQTTDAILAAGGTATWTIGRDTSTAGPIILITSVGASAHSALLTMQKLIETLSSTLRQLQIGQNVSATAFITTTTLRADSTATIDRKSQLRAVIGAAAAGLFLTVLLVAFVDSRLTRSSAPKPAGRRRRRRRTGADDGVRVETELVERELVENTLDSALITKARWPTAIGLPNSVQALPAEGAPVEAAPVDAARAVALEVPVVAWPIAPAAPIPTIRRRRNRNRSRSRSRTISTPVEPIADSSHATYSDEDAGQLDESHIIDGHPLDEPTVVNGDHPLDEPSVLNRRHNRYRAHTPNGYHPLHVPAALNGHHSQQDQNASNGRHGPESADASRRSTDPDRPATPPRPLADPTRARTRARRHG